MATSMWSEEIVLTSLPSAPHKTWVEFKSQGAHLPLNLTSLLLGHQSSVLEEPKTRVWDNTSLGLQTKGQGSMKHTLGHSRGLTTGAGSVAFQCASREKAGM